MNFRHARTHDFEAREFSCFECYCKQNILLVLMEKEKEKRVHKIILCEFKDLQEPATQLCRLKFQFFFC